MKAAVLEGISPSSSASFGRERVCRKECKLHYSFSAQFQLVGAQDLWLVIFEMAIEIGIMLGALEL